MSDTTQAIAGAARDPIIDPAHTRIGVAACGAPRGLRGLNKLITLVSDYIG